jgi:hypothetical protein
MTATLAELEIENARLRAEIDRLRPPPPPPATLAGPFQLPSRKQLQQLVTITLNRFACLRPRDRDIDDDFLAAVEAALRFLGAVTRLPEGQLDNWQERWQDRCRQWLNRNPPNTPFDFYSFHVAVIAAGDIDFADPALVGFGGTISFGLTESGIGRAARNSWLTILERGQIIRQPVPPKHQVKEWSPVRREIDMTAVGMRARR